MQELEKAIEILDKLLFFGGQRAGRELWNDKPRKVQDEDIASFNRDVEYLRDIIRKHMNGGWIPVEERLPTMEEYQKDDGRFILDDGNRRCAGYYDVYTGRFYSYRHITPYRAELYEDNRIIAWRPLPEPYRPEPETEKPDWRQDMLRKFDRRD